MLHERITQHSTTPTLVHACGVCPTMLPILNAAIQAVVWFLAQELLWEAWRSLHGISALQLN